jgi:hypothetical protein
MEWMALLPITIVLVWIWEKIFGKFYPEREEKLPALGKAALAEIDEKLDEIFELLRDFDARNGEDPDVGGFGDREEVSGYIRFDLYRLFAYLSAWDGVVTREERGVMKSVLGYAPTEEEILSFAAEMDQEMENDGYIFSPICYRLVRLEPGTARSYLEKLGAIGRIMLRESGETKNDGALEYFLLTGRMAIDTHSGRYSREDSEELEHLSTVS